MNLNLSHKEAKKLFFDFADDALAPDLAAKLSAHLESCQDCRGGLHRYTQAVTRVKALPDEAPPASLAGNILRRARLRRPLSARMHWAYVHHRLPVEILVPVLLAAAVAALVVLLSP